MGNWTNKLIVILCIVAITFFIFSSQKNGAQKNESILIDNVAKLLSEKSPYFDINNKRVISKIDSVRNIINNEEITDEKELLSNVEHIISELGDRHASVKILSSNQNSERYYLPFALAPWQKDRVIALRQLPKLKYSFYLEDYPFLKEIENENIVEYIYNNDVINKYAPTFSRLTLGVEKMNEFYQIGRNYNVGDSIKLTFSNKNKTRDTLMYLTLTDDKTKWRELNKFFFNYDNDQESYNTLKKSYKKGIEYLKIPKMFDKSENEPFFQWLEDYMNSIKNSNVLIIDIRNNSGGKRDLINFFSNYFIKPNEYLLANYALYKSELTDDIKKSLNRRGLYDIGHYGDDNQKLILEKMPVVLNDKFKGLNYSNFFYMVLGNNKLFNNYYFYDKPIYIIMNERTFSAASVFASSFKGLKNVTTVGVKSDGSSGLAQSYELNGLKLKFSHMLSLQKNGQLFDGVGTEPDIKINRSINQILGTEDHQLNFLLSKILKNHNLL